MTSSILRRVVGIAASAALAGAASVAMAPQAQAAPAVWDRVAACESSGNWKINTGNGYYGGLQFSPATWRGFGGTEYASMAHRATKAEQIAIAQRVLAVQGPGAWPVCSQRAGLTKANGGADRDAEAGRSSSTSERSSGTSRSQSSERSAPKQKSSTGTGSTVTVKSGDTLSKLARVHDVDGGWKAIADVNDLADPNYLSIGQKLRLPR